MNDRATQLPAHDDVVVRYLLEKGADQSPEATCVSFEDGTAWTRRDALEHACRAANVLRSLGVRQDATVAIFLPNGPDFLRAWWGAAMLGARIAPVNRGFRGAVLTNLIELAEPVVIVADDDLLERLDDAAAARIRVLAPRELQAGEDVSRPELERELRLWDIAALLLTSGTTGPSKLSATTGLQLYVSGWSLVGAWGGGPSDITLLDLPLFHLAALFITVGSLCRQVPIAVRSAPALDRYWEVARDTGATMAVVLSSMVPYLLAQEPRPAEKQHRLRLMMAAPLPDDLDAFQMRFHIAEFTTAYGMTEIPGALGRLPGQPIVPGYCGRLRPFFEVRLVDDNDVEVPVGEVGQAVVRTLLPWMLSAGYVKNPEATATVWRNGWFHTGDLLRRDADSNYFFVDRAKDSVRRRGENVSTYEVERELLAHPGVVEVACVAHRADEGVDDEVKVWLVGRAGQRLDFEELLRFCVAAMPHFMVPRYFEQIDALPKTASARIQKYLLRERGNGPQTWDREARGWKLTRDGLSWLGERALAAKAGS